MKQLVLLAICAGCTFGASDFELIDQGGIRIRPESIHINDGGEVATIDDVFFTSSTDWLAGETPLLELRFEHAGHSLILESVQMERLTVAGGQALLHVDGIPQVVDVETNATPDSFRSSMVSLRFDAQVAGSVLAIALEVEADYHCPPFDDTPAEVEDIATLE